MMDAFLLFVIELGDGCYLAVCGFSSLLRTCLLFGTDTVELVTNTRNSFSVGGLLAGCISGHQYHWCLTYTAQDDSTFRAVTNHDYELVDVGGGTLVGLWGFVGAFVGGSSLLSSLSLSLASSSTF